VVCFEEIRDPWSGSEHDGNPQHRHVVRITEVIADRRDPLFGVPLVEIAWDEADALPFTLWVVKPPDAAWETEDNFPVTVARGNMLLVDHGRRNQSALKLKPSHGRPPAALDRDYPAPRIRSELPETDLTFADTLPDSGAPAASQLRQDPRRATPHLILRERSNEQDVLSAFSFHELRDLRRVAKRLLDALVREAAPWASNALPRAARCQFHVGNACGGCDDAELQQALRGMKRLRDAIKDDLRAFWLPQYDLMNSGPADSHFVVEMSDERVARLRFGQGGFGRVPYVHDDPHQPEMTAFYRVGNGTAGNVGAEAICLVGSHGQSIEQITNVRNPLSAVGGVDPESPRQIRLFAPHAVRADLRRAVTAGDYVQIVMRDFGEKLQSAKASARWTGHEVEILIAVDPRGSETPDPQLLRSIQAALRKYKRIGHNVSVRAAERVVPTLQLSVCLEPRTLRETARGRMNALFSNRVQSDGSLGFFHPDRLSFGNGVFVSQIVAAQLRVPGVVHMEVTQLHRSDQGPADELETGVLPLRALEIVRFDNDPGHPERGVLDLILEGGR
jgi:predicted phage baseplate assembly protein